MQLSWFHYIKNRSLLTKCILWRFSTFCDTFSWFCQRRTKYVFVFVIIYITIILSHHMIRWCCRIHESISWWVNLWYGVDISREVHCLFTKCSIDWWTVALYECIRSINILLEATSMYTCIYHYWCIFCSVNTYHCVHHMWVYKTQSQPDLQPLFFAGRIWALDISRPHPT